MTEQVIRDRLCLLSIGVRLFERPYRDAVDERGVGRRETELCLTPNPAHLVRPEQLKSDDGLRTSVESLRRDVPFRDLTLLYASAFLKTSVLVPISPTPRVSSIILLLLLITPSVSWGVLRPWIAAPKLPVMPWRG